QQLLVNAVNVYPERINRGGAWQGAPPKPAAPRIANRRTGTHGCSSEQASSWIRLKKQLCTPSTVELQRRATRSLSPEPPRLHRSRSAPKTSRATERVCERPRDASLGIIQAVAGSRTTAPGRPTLPVAAGTTPPADHRGTRSAGVWQNGAWL